MVFGIEVEESHARKELRKVLRVPKLPKGTKIWALGSKKRKTKKKASKRRKRNPFLTTEAVGNPCRAAMNAVSRYRKNPVVKALKTVDGKRIPITHAEAMMLDKAAKKISKSLKGTGLKIKVTPSGISFTKKK